MPVRSPLGRRYADECHLRRGSGTTAPGRSEAAGGVLHEFDGAAQPAAAGDARVAGDERDVERFSERDVDRVVTGEVLPKLPRAGQQRGVRCAPDRHRHQVVEGEPSATRARDGRQRPDVGTPTRLRHRAGAAASRSPRSRPRSRSPSSPSSPSAVAMTLASTTITAGRGPPGRRARRPSTRRCRRRARRPGRALPRASVSSRPR